MGYKKDLFTSGRMCHSQIKPIGKVEPLLTYSVWIDDKFAFLHVKGIDENEASKEACKLLKRGQMFTLKLAE